MLPSGSPRLIDQPSLSAPAPPLRAGCPAGSWQWWTRHAHHTPPRKRCPHLPHTCPPRCGHPPWCDGSERSFPQTWTPASPPCSTVRAPWRVTGGALGWRFAHQTRTWECTAAGTGGDSSPPSIVTVPCPSREATESPWAAMVGCGAEMLLLLALQLVEAGAANRRGAFKSEKDKRSKAARSFGYWRL